MQFFQTRLLSLFILTYIFIILPRREYFLTTQAFLALIRLFSHFSYFMANYVSFELSWQQFIQNF